MVAQMVKNLPAMQEILLQSLGGEYPVSACVCRGRFREEKSQPKPVSKWAAEHGAKLTLHFLPS